MSDSVQSWLHPALSVMLGDRGTCDIRFSLQGDYVSAEFAADLRQLGIDDTVVTINGSALNAPKDDLGGGVHRRVRCRPAQGSETGS